jgi:DNA-binding protein HU-beta
MNKQDLINEVVKNLPSVSKSKAQKAIEAIFSVISEALSKGAKVTLSGFGTFYIAQRRARKGVNPRTKQPITIPAASVPKFRAGKNLGKAVK